jgi:hypothetical protein
MHMIIIMHIMHIMPIMGTPIIMLMTMHRFNYFLHVLMMF